MKLRYRPPAKRKRVASNSQPPKSASNKKICTGSLLSLPNEIVVQIASYIVDVRDIVSMIRVSKTFVTSMNKALYSSSSRTESFINDSIIRLFLFTRTILSSPELADTVTSITLGSTIRTEVSNTDR